MPSPYAVFTLTPPAASVSRRLPAAGRFALVRAALPALLVGLVLLIAGCTTPSSAPKVAGPQETQSLVTRLLPQAVSDREGWARDIQVAFTAQDLAPTAENLCAVIAITEQESTFQADPVVPGLPRIARAEIDRRAQSAHIPAFLVNGALALRSSTGQTYAQRLATVRTESGLSDIFEDFIGMAPLGKQLFGSFNPVRTGGPMQVSIDFAQSHAKDYPYVISGSLREEVFSRRGGMYFGTAHLLAYPAHYAQPLYRFADFNAGRYSSRNAAFQNAVSVASGIPLVLDGDLVAPGSSSAGATELAVRSLRRQVGLDDSAIRRALERGDSLEFEQTALYESVFRNAERAAGKPLPRAVLPSIKLASPKITRELTTAWFANRVQGRWDRCMARAGEPR